MKRMNATATAAILVCLVLSVAYLWHRDSNPEQAEIPPRNDVPAPVPVKAPQPIDIVSNDSLPLETRMAAFENLGPDLSESDVAVLTSTLFRKGDSETVRNECAVTLLHQQDVPDVMPELIASYTDAEESRKWVDYASQFMVHWYTRTSEPNRKKAVEVLQDAVENGDPELSGTAMLALQYISEKDPSVEEQAESLSEMHLNSDDPVRAGAAMNVAVRSGNKAVLPLARYHATRSGEIRQRLSSIAAIGALGNSDDMVLLEKLSKNSDPRIRRVASYQAGELRRRLASTKTDLK